MSHFKYKARNSLGKLIEGTVETETPSMAAQLISNRGMIPVAIEKTIINQDVLQQFNDWQALKQLNLSDLILFTRQMYSLTKAGVPIIRSIRSLVKSTRNPALATTLADIAKGLEAGNTLSHTLSQHPKIFDPLFTSIIDVGETTGELEQSFLQISQYLEREKTTQASIKAALRYPSMVIIAISIAMIIINIYVIPAFKTIFDRVHADLPWQTKLLMGISNFTVNYWPMLIIALIAGIYGFNKYINTIDGRLVWDRFLLKIPGIGSIIERATMERFSRSFAMILSSGVPLIQGIGIVANAVGNTYVGRKLNKMRIGIEKGDSISRMAISTQLFPDLVIQMIMVGEETGNISDMLLEVSDFYETEIDAELKNLASIIEPFLIVIIGIMVLILALGIFLPMWNLSSVMQ
jgi:MSHA biogenesis protein MshG